MKKNKSVLIIGFVLIAIVFTISIIWTDRSLDFWLSQYRGTSTDMPIWISAIVAIVGNAITLLFNVLSEVARIFIS